MDYGRLKLIQWIGGLIMGVCILTTGMGRLEQSKRMDGNFVPVQATVNNVGRLSQSGTNTRKYGLTISYTYNGKNYVGTLHTDFYQTKGDTMQVWVYRDNPAVCREESSMSPLGYVLIVVGGLLTILMLVKTIKEVIAIKNSY